LCLVYLDIEIINSNEACKEDVRPDANKVNIEERVVSCTHTVVHPMAMVVKSVNAFVTDEAMP